jgi:hypothetical protein
MPISAGNRQTGFTEIVEMAVVLREVVIPDFGSLAAQPEISATTYDARCKAARSAARCDWLVVYADREHFGNILFLSGFEPRFEEAFLLLGPRGERVLITGNESESYAQLACLPGLQVIVAQSLSLMGQDRSRFPRLVDRFRDAGIAPGDDIALVGWKYLEPGEDDDLDDAFFVPAVHVAMLRRLIGKDGTLRDATPVLMHPERGLRTRLDAEQIAAFEWSAARCSRLLWRIIAGLKPGDSEHLAFSRGQYEGDPLSVHPMLASSSRGEAVIGLRSPGSRILQKGDGVAGAIGFWGALTARAGLIDTGDDGFLGLAKSYFEGLLAWYRMAEIGATGGHLEGSVGEALARGGLCSTLNPGHLTAHEEWTHSPVRPASSDTLQSGMVMQVDIIPAPMQAGWALNCEDPVAFADAGLRGELASRFPDTFARIVARRDFMRTELGVELSDSILPLSSTPMCLAPFWLASFRLLGCW